MQVQIAIIAQPIDPQCRLPDGLAGAAGARVDFQGLVRSEEEGRPIAALEYEAYTPMAEQMMRRIVEELGRFHPCLFVRVIHRVGSVPVGEAAIHVTAAGQHRAEALAMVTGFMDRLKKDVPIWKVGAVNCDQPESGKRP